MALNLTKIISGVNETLGLFNRAIPIYKQVSPIVKNVKSAFSTFTTVKEEAKKERIKEMKKFERPVSILKKKNDSNRGDFNLDTLTFFQ